MKVFYKLSFVSILISSLSACHVIQYSIGETEYKSGNYCEAVKWWKISAEANYAPAQNNLGMLYHNGLCVPQNAQKAFELYKKAAEQGNSAGIYNVGQAYDDGYLGNSLNSANYVVQPDKQKAFKLYELSCEKGDSLACEKLKR